MSSVPQGRPAPAYQEYAASTLADMRYRMLSLVERGLYDTLKRELWVNRYMPRDAVKLSRVLGLPAEDVVAALPAVMQFYEEAGDFIISPEHEQYRACLDERRNRQVAGGEIGARATNSKRRSKKDSDIEEGSATPTATPSSTSSSTPTATPASTPSGDSTSTTVAMPSSTPTGSGRVLSTVQNSTAKTSQKQSSVSESVDDDFVRGYDAEEAARERRRAALAYAAASRGE
jgi:uncharacterized protein YdaU (DUF1376 family)